MDVSDELYAHVAGGVRQHWGRRWVFLPAAARRPSHAARCLLWSIGHPPAIGARTWPALLEARYGTGNVTWREPLYSGELRP